MGRKWKGEREKGLRGERMGKKWKGERRKG